MLKAAASADTHNQSKHVSSFLFLSLLEFSSHFSSPSYSPLRDSLQIYYKFHKEKSTNVFDAAQTKTLLTYLFITCSCQGYEWRDWAVTSNFIYPLFPKNPLKFVERTL